MIGDRGATVVMDPVSDPNGEEGLTIEARLAYHLDEMNLWATGKRSFTNLIPDQGVVAIMDAQEVVKHSAAVQAYASLVDVAALYANGGRGQ